MISCFLGIEYNTNREVSVAPARIMRAFTQVRPFWSVVRLNGKGVFNACCYPWKSILTVGILVVNVDYIGVWDTLNNQGTGHTCPP